MGGGAVDEGVLLVEAAALDLARLLLLVDDGERAVEAVDARLGDHDAVAEGGVPLDAAHVRHAQLVDDALGAQVVEEESVVGGDEDFAERRREDHVDLGEALLDDGPLARVRAVEAGHEYLAAAAVQRADTVLADENAGESVLSALLQSATGLSQIFIKRQQDELSAFDVKVEDEVMTTLIKAVVVDMRRLVEQDLLSCRLDRGHDLLVPCAQVVHVKLFLLDEEE